jgi:hypothetical protein
VAQGLPRTIAAALIAAGVVHCSLIAPSDQELMGGNKGGGSGSGSGGSGSGGDAGDAGRSDAMDGSSSGGDGGACGQEGDCCNTTANCCSGLACNQSAGICVACTPNGGGCSGGFNMCCSGNCTGHSCR